MMGELRVDGTVLCRELRGSQAAQRSVLRVCVSERTAHGSSSKRRQQSSSSSAARDPGPVALCRVRKGRDQGHKPASPFPCLCACLPAVSPKRNGRILVCTS